MCTVPDPRTGSIGERRGRGNCSEAGKKIAAAKDPAPRDSKRKRLSSKSCNPSLVVRVMQGTWLSEATGVTGKGEGDKTHQLRPRLLDAGFTVATVFVKLHRRRGGERGSGSDEKKKRCLFQLG